MSAAEGSTAVRLLSWFPLAFFGVLIATMAIVAILPPDRHLAYAVVEWVEMIVGTVSAVVAFVGVFLWPRIASPVLQGWSRYKWLAICGLGIWSIFWLIALLARPLTD
jgi:hypothetical protein